MDLQSRIDAITHSNLKVSPPHLVPGIFQIWRAWGRDPEILFIVGLGEGPKASRDDQSIARLREE